VRAANSRTAKKISRESFSPAACLADHPRHPIAIGIAGDQKSLR
jgi:hypothetical protein